MTSANVDDVRRSHKYPVTSASLGISKEIYFPLGISKEIYFPLGSKAYRGKHGQAASLHGQWVDGCERMVRSYTEEDRDLMVAAIESV
jgi:hypothetical protein